MATPKPVTQCHACTISDSMPKFRCMTNCDFRSHATCILEMSPRDPEDQGTHLCIGCDARWLPAMAQFLEPMAESEKEKGLELDSDGVPQQGGKVKRALKPEWLPKVVQKRPKGPAKPGVTLKKAHKHAKGKSNEEEKEGQASVKLEEVPCPNCKTWKGIPSSGNFNKHVQRCTGTRQRKVKGPQPGDKDYVEGCEQCAIGFYEQGHKTKHLNSRNHCVWYQKYPVEEAAAPQAEAPDAA